MLMKCAFYSYITSAKLVTFNLADYSYQLTPALTAAVRKARDEAELDANN